LASYPNQKKQTLYLGGIRNEIENLQTVYTTLLKIFVNKPKTISDNHKQPLKMKKIFTFSLALLSFYAFGQDNPTADAQPIVAEGKLLYKSEMASWYGTDLFLENYKKSENIGGYFSYTDNKLAKCIFFSKEDKPKVIGTISFDSTYNTKAASISLTEREFTKMETDLFEIRKLALTEINDDSLFQTYKNTNLNLIPLINGKDRKVYVLTGPKNSGVVIFGNDYLLTFDDSNKLLVKKQLHKNIIPVYYGGKEENKQNAGAMHSHLPETGQFMTATDICTLMLYEKFAKWEQHIVISEKYMNIWSCKTDQLTVIPKSTIDKIDNDKGKSNKKDKKKDE
jgi:hypothetical protein